MNGPDHYARAEALLDSCQQGAPDMDDEGRLVECYPATESGPPSDGGEGPWEEVNTIGNALLAAQVHATLALTGVLATLVPPDGSGKYRAWDTATGSLGEAGDL